jgi:hypothetical protein
MLEVRKPLEIEMGMDAASQVAILESKMDLY